MQLLFLRHGSAEPKNEWSGDDDDRPLSAQGQLTVTDVGRSLPRLAPRPDLILTSPLARARETAEIACECLDVQDKVVIEKRLAPGFELKHLEKIVREHADREVLMLVGHDPDCSELVRELTGGGRLSIRKGGLAQVELPNPKVMKGRLVSLLVPVSVNPEPPEDADARAG
jgi:phosphohistidine phosphatase